VPDKPRGKTKVRTTMQPDKEIEVGPQEFLDLQRQGLLYEGKAGEARAARKAASDEESGS
jgi:hypothetical protein